MGQHWVLAALDRREVTRCCGRLGEIFFSSEAPALLVQALAVPVSPLSRFTPTPAFSDAGNSGLPIIPNGVNEAVGPDKCDDLFSRQYRDSGLAKTLSLNRKRNSRSLTCGLLRLSNELLDLILQYLEVEELLLLGLQTQRLWNLARRHIQLYYASFCGQWAGSRIICSGDYTKLTDDPPGILSEAEREELKATLIEVRYASEDDSDFTSRLYNIYQFADLMYEDFEESRPLSAQFLEWQAMRLEGWKRLPESARAQISDELYQYDESEVFYTQNDEQTWILRNLTTLEYIRPEAIAITAECIEGPFIAGVGFGHLVLSRICWSSDSNCGMYSEAEIYRGVWAGHRFDITTFDRHNQSEKNKEWKDISNEAAAWIQKIWSAELGVNWRDFYSEKISRSQQRRQRQQRQLE